MDLEQCVDEAKCYSLFITRAETQLMVTLIAAILLTNMVLKRSNVVLAKVRPNLTFDSCMELFNSSINDIQHLSLPELVMKVGKKSSRALHDKAIRNVVPFDEHPPEVSARSKAHLKDTSLVHLCGRHQDFNQSTKTSSSSKEPAAKISQTPCKKGKGKKLSQLLLCHEWEVY